MQSADFRSAGVSPAYFLMQAAAPAPFYPETLPVAASKGGAA
jgi:hypothetical protein